MYLPEWDKKHKEKCTKIKKIGNGFYKYQVALVYTRKTEKKTLKLLGKITE